ncbi:MAG TPA: o-succinylbenzoate synthase [Flavobacteriales bacterium]|jgi:o-succinylbenzoate synthase|nr:o-succinylbenzoate synthase [Flavobacteriales bacterium]
MIHFKYRPITLDFTFSAGTSRGVLRSKPSWVIILEIEGSLGIGECSLIPGLSPDNPGVIESKLENLRKNGVYRNKICRKETPALFFALEMAYKGLENRNPFLLFDNEFSKSRSALNINGLVWMSDAESMLAQAKEKASSGFNCIKFKVGALPFEQELKLLQEFRDSEFGVKMEIRLDANGAFTKSEALNKLEQLSRFNIHSIEQPIQPGQWPEMKRLCQESPIPVALDEELIGIQSKEDIQHLLDYIEPQYIILKPSLIGGFEVSDCFVEEAEKRNTGWWATSALESNIGLNAIAQWAASKNNDLPQGLGTGGLFHNNFESPLQVERGCLNYRPDASWADIETWIREK